MQKHRDIIQKLFAADEYARQLGIVLDELTDTTMKSVSYRTGRPIDPDVNR